MVMLLNSSLSGLFTEINGILALSKLRFESNYNGKKQLSQNLSIYASSASKQNNFSLIEQWPIWECLSTQLVSNENFNAHKCLSFGLVHRDLRHHWKSILKNLIVYEQQPVNISPFHVYCSTLGSKESQLNKN